MWMVIWSHKCRFAVDYLLAAAVPGWWYHRLFYRVILHKLCIIKINLCIIKCQIVYL